MEHLKELSILAVCLMVLRFSCCTLMRIWFMDRNSVFEESLESNVLTLSTCNLRADLRLIVKSGRTYSAK